MKHAAWCVKGMLLMFWPAWSAGVASSTRVNTVAAQAYADALDLQSQSVHEQQGIDLKQQIAVQDRAMTSAATVAAAKLKASEEQYTEMVIGLRAQLQAAGVPERIVRATR